MVLLTSTVSISVYQDSEFSPNYNLDYLPLNRQKYREEKSSIEVEIETHISVVYKNSHISSQWETVVGKQVTLLRFIDI